MSFSHTPAQHPVDTIPPGGEYTHFGQGWAVFSSLILLIPAIAHFILLALGYDRPGQDSGSVMASVLISGIIFWSGAWSTVLHIVNIRLETQGWNAPSPYFFLPPGAGLGTVTALFITMLFPMTGMDNFRTLMLPGLILIMTLLSPLSAYLIAPRYFAFDERPTLLVSFKLLFWKSLLLWFCILILTAMSMVLAMFLIGFIFAGIILGVSVMLQAKMLENFFMNLRNTR